MGTAFPAHKEVKKVARRWQKAGYSITPTASGHWRVSDADGHVVDILPSSPGDHRWVKNSMARFKRIVGLDGQKKPQKEVTVAGTASFTPSPEQERVSNQMFKFLRTLGWPNEIGIRAEVVRQVMSEAEQDFGKNGVWRSHGSANAALTDLLSNKRKVGEKALVAFDKVSADVEVPVKVPKKGGWTVDKSAGPEKVAESISRIQAILDEIEKHNHNGKRKGHNRNFGTTKYLALWMIEEANLRGNKLYAPRATGISQNAIDERIRSADAAYKGRGAPLRAVTNDLLMVAQWWDEADEQHKWRLVPQMGLAQFWEVPEAPKETPEQVMERWAAEDAALIGHDQDAEDAVGILDDLAKAVPQMADTLIASLPTYPLHMRVLYALADSRNVSKTEALEMALEIAKLEGGN